MVNWGKPKPKRNIRIQFNDLILAWVYEETQSQVPNITEDDRIWVHVAKRCQFASSSPSFYPFWWEFSMAVQQFRFLLPRQRSTKETSESAALEGDRLSSVLDHPRPFWLSLERMKSLHSALDCDTSSFSVKDRSNTSRTSAANTEDRRRTSMSSCRGSGSDNDWLPGISCPSLRVSSLYPRGANFNSEGKMAAVRVTSQS